MRILSYNIRGGLGMDGCRDIARITECVARQQSDIVCFQEVHQRLPQSAFIDQPRRIEEALGMAVVFQANLKILPGGYGIAIATRLPRGSIAQHRLPSVGETRGALQVEMETERGPLTIFCTHFGLNHEERQTQAAALAVHVKAASAPTVVCGDFNALPDGDYLARFAAETGLADWGADSGAPTFPSDAPRSRIDVIYGSKELRAENFVVIESLASDHLPVVADFGWAI